jgi:hypothetical protein
MEMTIATTEAIPVLERVDSISTISSQDSEETWSIWLFGRSHSGGKRFRKSRRHLKMKKTRKGRGKKYSTKKNRISKKRRHVKRHTKRHR